MFARGSAQLLVTKSFLVRLKCGYLLFLAKNWEFLINILHVDSHKLLRSLISIAGEVLKCFRTCDEPHWIVLGPSPFQVFRKNVLFEYAIFDRRQTQNHAQFFTGRSRLRQIATSDKAMTAFTLPLPADRRNSANASL